MAKKRLIKIGENMKIILFIITFIIGIFIAKYLLIDTTLHLNANIIIFKEHSIPYKEPIGRTLTNHGVALENPNQEFDVVVEYVVNKEKLFELFTLPVCVLQNRMNDSTIPITIDILYFRFLPGDFISIVKIDGQIIKSNYFFNSNYRKFIKG